METCVGGIWSREECALDEAWCWHRRVVSIYRSRTKRLRCGALRLAVSSLVWMVLDVFCNDYRGSDVRNSLLSDCLSKNKARRSRKIRRRSVATRGSFKPKTQN